MAMNKTMRKRTPKQMDEFISWRRHKPREARSARYGSAL